MTDNQASPQAPNSNLPQAKVHRRGFTWIWLIPIVCLGIVGWLAWQHFSAMGPTITITFQRADGLEAGRTLIKHKSVTVGVVKSIELSDDLNHVIVTAEMDNSVEDYLGKDAKFWVVRPRFNAGNITGLDTLVSGSYIVMRPAKGDEETDFKGLENPPVDVYDVPGQRFTLHTDHLAALDEGSAIYYHGIDVGTVLGYKLNDKGDSISVFIFVRAPYDKFVTQETRFWNASGIDVTTGANGLEIKTESFRALLTGGITFDTPTNSLGAPVAQDYSFPLYESQRESEADPRGPHFYYLIDFPGSVHGLSVRAPVELNGIRIGRVVDISQHIDISTGAVRTPVTVEIEQEQLTLTGSSPKHNNMPPLDAMNYALDQIIRKGIRAQLATGSLLTGQRFVQMSFHPESPPAKLIVGGGPAAIPAVEGGTLDDATRSATVLLQHLDKTVDRVDTLMENLNQLTGPGPNDLQETVKDLDRVLNNVDGDLRPLGTQLPQLLKELKNTARSATSLLDYVDQNPQALLLGRSNSAAAPASDQSPTESQE